MFGLFIGPQSEKHSLPKLIVVRLTHDFRDAINRRKGRHNRTDVREGQRGKGTRLQNVVVSVHLVAPAGDRFASGLCPAHRAFAEGI